MCTRCQYKAATTLFAVSIRNEQDEEEIVRMLDNFHAKFSSQIGTGWKKDVIAELNGHEPATTIVKGYVLK